MRKRMYNAAVVYVLEVKGIECHLQFNSQKFSPSILAESANLAMSNLILAKTEALLFCSKSEPWLIIRLLKLMAFFNSTCTRDKNFIPADTSIGFYTLIGAVSDKPSRSHTMR